MSFHCMPRAGQSLGSSWNASIRSFGGFFMLMFMFTLFKLLPANALAFSHVYFC
ncbi:hypothetical protein BDW69DRAFT_173681, partial [Aspergillus filifer]